MISLLGGLREWWVGWVGVWVWMWGWFRDVLAVPHHPL